MNTVLIIEDDDRFRQSCVTLLERAGYGAIGVRHGGEALRRLHDATIDLVLTDVLMPEMDGLETIIALQRNHPRLRVIAMSGGGAIGREDALAMCRHLGVVATLEKPFSQEELLGAVIEALAGPASDSEVSAS